MNLQNLSNFINLIQNQMQLFMIETEREKKRERERETQEKTQKMYLESYIEGTFHTPHFTELLLRWILLTKPSSTVVKKIWENIVAFDYNTTEPRLSYDVLIDFKDMILNSGHYDFLTFRKPFGMGEWGITGIGYSNCSSSIEIKNLHGVFKRVKEKGHCVLGLPIEEPEFRKCTYYNDRDYRTQRRSPTCYTLAIEAGYYVVRNTTSEEFHGQCIQDQGLCKDISLEESWDWDCHCYFRHVSKYGLIFFNLWNPYISLFLNKKEVVDDLLTKMTAPPGTHASMKILYSY